MSGSRSSATRPWPIPPRGISRVLKYGRVSADAIEISCGEALGDLEDKLAGLSMLGSGSRCTTPLLEGALRQLGDGSGLGNELLPDSFLPRARNFLGLGGWVVGHARPGGLLGYVALTRRITPGQLTQYEWDRVVQWATYLVKT